MQEYEHFVTHAPRQSLGSWGSTSNSTKDHDIDNFTYTTLPEQDTPDLDDSSVIIALIVENGKVMWSRMMTIKICSSESKELMQEEIKNKKEKCLERLQILYPDYMPEYLKP